MKTKFCTEECKDQQYKMHTSICLYKRRDAGEFDEVGNLKKLVKELEKRVKFLEEHPSGNNWCNARPTC